jgi:uncharacterized lipoprotein YmbA
MRARLVALLVLPGLGLAAPGCVLKRTPEARFFVLRSLAEPPAAPPAEAPATLVGVLPVRMPGYIDRPQLVTWTAPGELRIDEFLRWAEPLDAGITRTVAENLDALLPESHVVRAPWAARAQPRCRVWLQLDLFGPQAGFDLWWNVHPGINLGFGLKGAWVQNDAKRQTILTGNSLDPLATAGTIELRDTRRNGTYLVDFEATLIYRLSHSWSLRSSYYALAVDEVGFGTVDGELARAFVTAAPISEPDFVRDSLVVQGISFGTEYMW